MCFIRLLLHISMPRQRTLQMTSFARACGALPRPTQHLQLLYWYPVSWAQIPYSDVQPWYHKGFIGNKWCFFIVYSWCELCKWAEWPTPSPWFPGDPHPWQPYIVSPAAACPLPCGLSGDHSWLATTHACQSTGRSHRCFSWTWGIIFDIQF